MNTNNNVSDNVNDEPRIIDLANIEGKKEQKIKISKKNLAMIIVGVAVVVTVGALQFSKGFFVAAMVNGRPISRWSVIQDLENKSGKQTLDFLITEKLIKGETGQLSISQEDIDNEIKKIEQQVTSQGGTFDDALAQQGITREQLQEQIIVQKKVEKMLADKITVSDEEVNAYVKDNKIKPPQGRKMEDVKIQLKEQLQRQKFGQIAQQWIAELKTKAKIKYYVNY